MIKAKALSSLVVYDKGYFFYLMENLKKKKIVFPVQIKVQSANCENVLFIFKKNSGLLQNKNK